MLARSAMAVVFVPGETISQGIPVSTGLTAGNSPKSFGYGDTTFKVPQ